MFPNRKAKAEGVWCWDSKYNEPVLVLPVVLALLGDNPMQSKFACHIGMHGKMFCQACWVKGADALVESTEHNNNQDESDAESARSSDGNASRGKKSEGQEGESNLQASAPGATPNPLLKKKGKFVESLSSMISRVTLFMKVCITVLCTTFGFHHNFMFL